MTGSDRTHGIDRRGVEAWFADEVGVAGPLRFEMVEGGHSCLTYLVDTPDDERFVLRRPPVGDVLATAHDVLREHRVISALAGTAVPVAPVVGSCDDPEVTGAPFYVMDFVAGTVLHDRAAAELLTPGSRRDAALGMVEVLVALQHVEPDDVGLGDLARRDDYLGRQLRRWHRQWQASSTRPLPRMEELHGWLVANQPPEDDATIVHGDFRLGNAIHRDDGSVAALLDWELCTLGPRSADVSYLLRSWDRAPGAERTRPSDAEGFPDRAELVEHYERISGRPLQHLDYWTAFHAWRSACIVAGVYTRYITGQMGDAPSGVEQFEQSVADGLSAGLDAAGIT